jgi:RHS repeat-associated protein
MKICFCTIFLLLTISGFSQEYSYDPNGNMFVDANKEISHIHYNILNLPDTIVYDDGRTVIYTFTALGKKLSQHVVAANGTLLQKQDYIDDFQYRNDTLREIRHSEGRVVPNPASSWEYQYHLTDHLGNVRSTITSLADTIEYLASMETESAAREQIVFDGLEKNRVGFVTANHTARGDEVVQLRSDKEAAAVSMDLAVQSGDVVYLQVHAYYEGDGSPTTKNGGSSLSTILLPIVLGAFNGAQMVAESPHAMLSTGNIAGGLTAPSEDKNVPKAHLNYQLFDKEYQAVDGGFVAVSERASFNGELLTLGPIKIQRSGYLYVYLSNSSEENIPVYFDDLKVTLIPTPIIQEDGCDPFGLTLTEQHVERFGAEPNNYLFNGKELQNEFDLNWYDYGARMYDPALGRWHVIDPDVEKNMSWAPYQYVMNNPLKYIDPRGKNAELIINHKNKTVTVRANYYHSDNSSELQSGLDVWNDFSGKEKVTLDQIEYTLNFDLKAVKVKKDEVDAKRLRDPIGNSFKVQKQLPAGQNGDIGGLTTSSNNILSPQKIFDDRNLNIKSHLLVAHEIGHTLMGLEQMPHEHTPSTVMNENNGFHLTNKLDNIIVNRILITFGVVTSQSITRLQPVTAGNAFISNNFRVTHIR